MDTQESRRSFIGSVVFGIPLLAAGSAEAFTQSFRVDSHDHTTAAAADPLLEHVDQQFAAMLRDMRIRGNGMRLEDARIAAAYLQVLAVHGQSRHLDDRARRSLQARIEARGREAVLQETLNVEHLRKTLATRGIEVPERLVTVIATAPLAERAKAMEVVLGGNTSRVFTQLASAVEAVIPSRADDGPLRPVAFGDDGSCSFYMSQMMMYFGIASGFCMYVTGDPYFDGWCVTMWSGALLAQSIYWSMC